LISRALTDRDDVEGGQFFQRVETDLHISVGALAADIQLPSTGTTTRRRGGTPSCGKPRSAPSGREMFTSMKA
jgi:hypothetical protein